MTVNDFTTRQASVIQALVNYKKLPSHHPAFQQLNREDGWKLLSELPKNLQSSLSKINKKLQTDKVVESKSVDYWDKRGRLFSLKAYRLKRSPHALRNVIITLYRYNMGIFVKSDYAQDTFKHWFKWYADFYEIVTQRKQYIRNLQKKYGKYYYHPDGVGKDEVENDIFILSNLFANYLINKRMFKELFQDYNQILQKNGLKSPEELKELLSMSVLTYDYFHEHINNTLTSKKKQMYQHFISRKALAISLIHHRDASRMRSDRKFKQIEAINPKVP